MTENVQVLKKPPNNTLKKDRRQLIASCNSLFYAVAAKPDKVIRYR